MESKKLYYLAHPVAPNELNTYEENIEDGKKWWIMLLRRNIYICAPWLGLCWALDDADPVDRKIGMTVDKEVLKRCDGIILTGSMVSSGMQAELDLANDNDVEVIHFVGLSEVEAIEMLEEIGGM